MRRHPGLLARAVARDLRDAARYRRARRSLLSDLALAAEPDARPGGARYAAVVHVYYPDLWPTIEQALRALPLPLDVVVTLPDGVADPGLGEQVHVVRVPNRGRDVLAFSHVLRVLDEAGYTAVLKLHTKRSAHVDGGGTWFSTLLAELVPDDADLGRELGIALAHPTTGLVGAASSYHPFPLFLAENLADTRRELARQLGRREAGQVLARARELGFFAGTMFWARLDALSSFDALPPRRFAPERGQVNGTYAHALERLFCVVPAARGRESLEIDRQGVRPRPARTDHLPPWAGPDDLALDPVTPPSGRSA